MLCEKEPARDVNVIRQKAKNDIQGNVISIKNLGPMHANALEYHKENTQCGIKNI